MRMLIIDDSNESREAMTYIFKRRGLIVESAMNEKEALSGMKESLTSLSLIMYSQKFVVLRSAGA